jgi:membrane protein required for colicin V production
VNVFDVIVGAVLVAGVAIGASRGAMRIVIGIVSLLVAFFLASRYQDPLAATLMAHHVSQTPARIGAYAIVFLGTMIAGGLVALVVGKIVKVAMLSWADRLAGGALGLVAAALAAAFLVHPIAASSPEGSRLLASSRTAPYLSVVADLGNAVAPDAVAKRYDEGIAVLRKVWRGEAKLPDLSAVKASIGHAVDAGKKTVEHAAEAGEKALKRKDSAGKP